MRKKLAIPALAAALACLTACEFEDFGNSHRYTRDFHFSYSMKPSGRVSVETFNGSVEVTGWDQDTVDISGTKYASTETAADDLKVEISNSPDAVSVRVVRPSERGNMGARMVLKVPRGARVDRVTSSNSGIRISDANGPSRLKTSNGSIRVENMRGGLDVETTNSSMEFTEIDGDVTGHTSNGRVVARGVRGTCDVDTSNSSVSIEAAVPDHPVRVDTSNGSVELRLPAGFHASVSVKTSNSSITVHMAGQPNAQLIARTSNSSITSDFETRTSGEVTKRHMEGTLGNGGPLMELDTSNGSIRILRM